MRTVFAKTTGGLTWRAAWPSDAPELHHLELPPRLQVPVLGDGSELSAVKPAGTQVLKGQLLTERPLESCATPLAPTSGRIVGSSRITLVGGRETSAIDIECDFEDRAPPDLPQDSLGNPQQELAEDAATADAADLSVWIERFLTAGLGADRVASPDLIAQLVTALRRPIDTVLCNLVDGEPPLRLNVTLASHLPQALVSGIVLLARLTGAVRPIIATAGEVPWRSFAPVPRLARKAGIIMLSAPARYPQDDPTLLLHDLLGRRLRPGRLPAEQGVLLLDAAAAIAVGRCATRQQPMLQAPLAVHDHLEGHCSYMVVPIGMSLRDVFKQGGQALRDITLRGGDALRLRPIGPEAVVGPAELAVHILPQRPTYSQPCIRCGLCGDACPTGVLPAGILQAAQSQDVALAEKHGLEACIECGVCEDLCPSRLPLLQAVRELRRARFSAPESA